MGTASASPVDAVPLVRVRSRSEASVEGDTLRVGPGIGHDREAQEGLETTWARQGEDGGLFAGGGGEHWKDTGVAMLSLVRQAELAQDWAYFDGMQALSR